jgi:hypothetical protein
MVQFLKDENGVLIAVEWVLVASVLFLGALVSLAAARQALLN